MYYYCTLFNKNYLTRGLAMIKSLFNHAQDFHLYILTFDEETFTNLSTLQNYPITTIRLSDFEDEELLTVKSARTLAEYCWTCTPAIIQYCISTFSLPHCTYIDADVFFFKNPNLLIDEMQTNSILLTKHNYAQQYQYFQNTSGTYCVQFMCFKADKNGLKALAWWKQKCLEWCFARFEDGKFGDQKYLDDWTERFEGVYVPSNTKYALAPWNIIEHAEAECVFYHFHNLYFIGENKVDLGGYKIPRSTKIQIYTPYIKNLIELRIKFLPHNYDLRSKQKLTLLHILRTLKRYFYGTYNVFYLTDFTQQLNA